MDDRISEACSHEGAGESILEELICAPEEAAVVLGQGSFREIVVVTFGTCGGNAVNLCMENNYNQQYRLVWQSEF